MHGDSDLPILPEPGTDPISRRAWELVDLRDENGLREFFQSGVSANYRCKDYGNPILFAAIGSGSPWLTKLFLDHGADVDAADDDANTALHDAVRWSTRPVVNILLSHGADPNVAEPKYGRYPLHIAAERGELCKLGVLLAHGAIVDCRRTNGETPLHNAAREGKVLAVQRLLTAGADMLTADDEGLEAMHHACLGGSVAVIRLLLRQGASAVRRCRQEALPLTAAAVCYHVEAWDVLVRAGGAATLTDDDQLQILTAGLVRGGPILDAILDLGISPDLWRQSGQSAIEWALANNRPHVAEQLQKRSAS